MPRKFITIAGGVLGAIAGFFFHMEGSYINTSLIGAVLGFIISAGINSFIGYYVTRKKVLENCPNLNNSKLQLREERLDITKKRVKTGNVNVHKEIISELKDIVVPVIREELVIEKKVLQNEAAGKSRESPETIRIPISEERIEIIKHPEIQEEVVIYREQRQEIEHIEEVLKKEKVNIIKKD